MCSCFGKTNLTEFKGARAFFNHREWDVTMRGGHVEANKILAGTYLDKTPLGETRPCVFQIGVLVNAFGSRQGPLAVFCEYKNVSAGSLK
jgi:hypothetical protein